MKITVVHTAFEDTPQIVAEVNYDGDSVESGLEYAYRWTNNVMGSWSRDDLEDNGDYNPAVKRVAPLHEDGMGLRSTSMGDMMHVNGRSFEVAMMGFQELVYLKVDNALYIFYYICIGQQTKREQCLQKQSIIMQW